MSFDRAFQFSAPFLGGREPNAMFHTKAVQLAIG